ncbi:MAG TPA: toll/interleukin-1 receptor domain-containing protein, partial [Pseudonocardiaceae bacterium]|nr:toll/interleukin-1 receptor domain-containing protein [Pseudonocardiaceae bacterium]
MPVLFVNYRVQEQPGYATLLHRELAQQFGANSVFLASRSIHAGDDFVHEVFDSLRRSAALIAVIGPRWQEFHGAGPFDWVHREIAEAFKLDIRVIPVLIEDAELPAADALPDDIVALSSCQYVRLRHYSIDADLAQLAYELRRTLPALREQHGDSVAEGKPTVFRSANE